MKSLNKIVLSLLSIALLIPATQVNATSETKKLQQRRKIILNSIKHRIRSGGNSQNGIRRASGLELVTNNTSNSSSWYTRLCNKSAKSAASIFNKTMELTGKTGSAIAASPSKAWIKTINVYNFLTKTRKRKYTTIGIALTALAAGSYGYYKYSKAKKAKSKKSNEFVNKK